ncbi:uncharacterized protein PpBr36_10560 [Pyricularia pennisetigena]|uniref:uncharacterized protein n=1 Tax=Pyricularia pennisetigena TaxID=1578925 RepID=UPI001150E2FC|nr:uncharacterized protein PpBr36_10560 [Pyricularia pennisetigena]TLS21107.1 hypothetical protein PpBr36_10560 [Pyricularia pennisetigena]
MSPQAQRQLCQEHDTPPPASDNHARPRYPQSPVPLPAIYVKAIERWNAEKSFQNRVASTSKETEVKFSSPSAATVLGTGKTTGSGIAKNRKKMKDKKKKAKTSKEPKNTEESEESREVSKTVIKLEGPQNIDKWHASLMAALGPLHHFVTQQFEELVRPRAEDEAACRQWDADKESAGKTLKSSLKKVKNLLKDRLHKSLRDQKDPYKFYSAVLRVMQAEADRSSFTSALVRRVCDLKVTDFDSLGAYQGHMQDLRCKLTLLDAYPGDRFMVLAAVNGLGTDGLTEGMLQVAIAPPNNSEGVKDLSVMGTIHE